MAVGDEPEFQLGLEEIKQKQTWIQVFAEYLGTFLLIFIGIGSSYKIEAASGSLLAVAIAFGFIIAVLVEMFAGISGAHLNPAVTLGVFVLGKISVVKSLLYVIAQLAGASIGMLALVLVLPEQFRLSNHGKSGIAASTQITEIQGMFIELAITAVLVLLVGHFVKSKKAAENVAVPIYFGLAVTALVLMAGDFSGANLNPARSFGPSLVYNSWSQQWLYWVGPLSGGALGGLLSRYLF